MSNTLFEQFGNQQATNSVLSFISEVKKFQQTFNGNAEEEVKKLLNSGQISQQDFNKMAVIANQLMPFINQS